MRFDDRLQTVLNQPTRSRHDRVVRWRQLVEILARAGGPATHLVEMALAEIRSERESIDEDIRAATARAIARPQLAVELVSYFAEDKVTIGAPVLAAASLSGEQWRSILEAATPDARRFIQTLHPELNKPEPQPEPEPAPREGETVATTDSTPPEPSESAAIPSISEVLARFEKLRQSRREAEDAAARTRRQPATEGIFRWEAGPSGEIAWVDGVPRGPLIGRSLANPGEHNGVDERIQRAFALRSPFRDARLHVSGEGPAGGHWKISGVPAFEPIDGRFAGYRGVAVRPEQTAADTVRARPPLDDDSLRELVHEVRTPLNAIIGFAEIIDSQYLGPADYAYRERAAQIVAQARLLLAAVEDLDLAARLRSSDAATPGEAEMAVVIAAVVPDLQERASRAGASIEVNLVKPGARCALEQGFAERIVRRFATAAVDALSSGERLTLCLDSDEQSCTVAVDRPKAMVAGTAGKGDDTGALGSDFSLRLAGALAQLAGGDVTTEDKRLILSLPSA